MNKDKVTNRIANNDIPHMTYVSICLCFAKYLMTANRDYLHL